MTKVRIEVERNQNADGAIAMNRTELQQVFINLIVNAIHAMPEGGVLRLSTGNKSIDDVMGVAVCIEDTGKGMSKETLDKIFDPFFTTKQREGTGLGLSISQTIITRYGGEISVASTEGVGTKFSIWLPIGEDLPT